MSSRLTVALRNHLGELPRVQDEVARYLLDHGASSDVQYLARLAVEELVSNVIRHGYDDFGEHEIRATLAAGPGGVDLVIEDDGRPFDPNALADPPGATSLEDAPTGGMGIALVRHMVGPMRHKREDGRNRLTIRIAPRG